MEKTSFPEKSASVGRGKTPAGKESKNAEKIISMLLAAVIAVTGLTIPAGAAANEREILWGYDLYDLLGLVRSNSVLLDVTNKNVMEGQRLNRMKAWEALPFSRPISLR